MLDKFDKNESPFKVPENYFENLNAEIMTKLPQKEKSSSVKKAVLWKKILPWTAIAAMLCGVIMNWDRIADTMGAPVSVSEAEILPDKTTVNQDGLASLSEEDFYLYVEDQVTATNMKEMLSVDY